MKTTFLILALLLIAGTTAVFSQVQTTEKFSVKGNCGLCKTRIQNVALSVDGVKKAIWNKETQILEVTFEPAKTNADKIQFVIAGLGHDTEKHKAAPEDYNKLPACCKYRD